MTSKFCENIFNPQFYMSSLFSHVWDHNSFLTCKLSKNVFLLPL
jgi:hypothetical protein